MEAPRAIDSLSSFLFVCLFVCFCFFSGGGEESAIAPNRVTEFGYRVSRSGQRVVTAGLTGTGERRRQRRQRRHLAGDCGRRRDGAGRQRARRRGAAAAPRPPTPKHTPPHATLSKSGRKRSDG